MKCGLTKNESSTCVLKLAVDHDRGYVKVALKFMRNKVQYKQEINAKRLGGFEADYVIITTLHGSNGDQVEAFRVETSRRRATYILLLLYSIVL